MQMPMQYKVARCHEHHEWARPSRLWVTESIGHVGYPQDGLGEMYERWHSRLVSSQRDALLVLARDLGLLKLCGRYLMVSLAMFYKPSRMDYHHKGVIVHVIGEVRTGALGISALLLT